MLLRVKGYATKLNDNDYKLELNIPALYLDNANYNISLRMLMMSLALLESETNQSQFWSLSTSAVDKTAINPKQEIASFCTTPVTSGSYYGNFVYYEPSIKREYKIQVTTIQTSEFILTSLRPDAELEIDHIEILFEFSRYARI